MNLLDYVELTLGAISTSFRHLISIATKVAIDMIVYTNCVVIAKSIIFTCNKKSC